MNDALKVAGKLWLIGAFLCATGIFGCVKYYEGYADGVIGDMQFQRMKRMA